jgi:hypothetical protein
MQTINNLHFNETIQIDTFPGATEESPNIITITDEAMAYYISTVIGVNNTDNLLQTLNTQWFNKFGYPG